MAETVISLVCERAADLNGVCNAQGAVSEVPGLHVVKLPCSGMVQPAMIEQAMKCGAQGVIVMGCQIGDCYYREGNKMIRERLLGNRPPGLKKTVDRRRVMALWLSRVQTKQFLSEAKEFIVRMKELPALEAAKPAPAAKAPGAAAPAAAKPAAEKVVDKTPVVDKADPEKEKKEVAADAQDKGKALEDTKVENPETAKTEEKKSE
ncbi:MAG TPA: hydrogenase iron-sulfur subunit [Oculatellaceae cyanobacterium]